MAEQKGDRRPKKGGDKKKQDQPKVSHKTNWTLARKERNVKRHLARDEKRAERANRPRRTPAGTERNFRRGLERAARRAALHNAVAATTPATEAERAGLFPERE